MIRIRGLFDSCAIIEKVMATKNTNYQLHLKGFVGGYGYVLRATSMSRVKKRSNLFGHSAFSFFIFQFLIFNLFRTVRVPCTRWFPVPSGKL